MSYAIRRLTGNDVAAYRDLRLEALVNHPDAFSTAAEDFALRSEAELTQLLELLVCFGAVTLNGELVGMMAFDAGINREAHRGWLIQAYVKPAMRGSGCAMDLLETVVAEAQRQVLQLHLSVASHNAPAIRLYQKAGFTIYGTDPRFQRVNGRFVDEHMMVRFFDKAPGEDPND